MQPVGGKFVAVERGLYERDSEPEAETIEHKFPLMDRISHMSKERWNEFALFVLGLPSGK